MRLLVTVTKDSGTSEPASSQTRVLSFWDDTLGTEIAKEVDTNINEMMKLKPGSSPRVSYAVLPDARG